MLASGYVRPLHRCGPWIGSKREARAREGGRNSWSGEERAALRPLLLPRSMAAQERARAQVPLNYDPISLPQRPDRHGRPRDRGLGLSGGVTPLSTSRVRGQRKSNHPRLFIARARLLITHIHPILNLKPPDPTKTTGAGSP
jgi:hypothetical protein